MIQAFVFSLICGPVVVTLALWLFSAAIARSHKETVVRVLADQRTRSSPRDLSRRLVR